jgi:ubiquinone/menaquinone biosynthesis C-methylase UbiE
VRGLEQVPWLYDGLCAVLERTGLGAWRRWLAAGARGRTLDVGCGTGRGLPLYGIGTRVVGLDPAWHSLVRARRRAPRVPLVQASAEALPFRSGIFDTVVSSLAFCSVPDQARGLTEVRRVLRPEGRLRMLEHVRSARAWKAAFQDRVQPLWTRLSGGCHPNRETERAVESAGFVIETDGRDAKADYRRFSARPLREPAGRGA